MKIAILSDFHIGYERFQEDAFRQAEQALQKAASLADVLIIPGDIFDYRHPKPEVIAEAITLFKGLAGKEYKAKVTKFEGSGKIYTNIPVIAIPGTHERRSQDATDPVDLLNLAGLLVNAKHSRVIIEKDSEKVAVFGVGGVADERFKETIEQLDPKPVRGAFNIFMFHQSIYELLPFSESFMHTEELPEGFDLYVDGHLHNKTESECHGKKFLIPGSTVLTQLKDGEQEEKGFFIYDTQTNQHIFHAIESRKFFSIKLDVKDKDPNEIREEIKAKIAQILKINNNKPIIRIEVRGKLKSGFRNMDLNTHDIVNGNKSNAIIEITKSIDNKDYEEIENLRKGMLDNISVKDYGMSIFLEKLRDSKYTLEISPSELFDMLSSEAKKEVILKETLAVLL